MVGQEWTGVIGDLDENVVISLLLLKLLHILYLLYLAITIKIHRSTLNLLGQPYLG